MLKMVRLRWSGSTRTTNCDEGLQLSLAAEPGQVVPVSEPCAKRLCAEDKAWVIADDKPELATKKNAK